MKKLLLSIVLVCVSLASFADNIQLKSDRPDTYEVKKGDTLWDISSMYLEDPWLWPDVWHINPEVANPHLIYPGDILRLIWVDDQPKVTVKKRGKVKLLAEMRTQPVDNAIPAIPLEKISAFLSRTRILNSIEELEGAPYVLAGEDKRIIAGAGDRLYARGDFDEEDSSFGVYRLGATYQDPETKEILGVEAKDIASVRMLDLDADVATMIVNRSAEELRIGDRLLASESKSVSSSFMPKSPDTAIKGQIIGVESAVRNAGNMSVVMINQGQREGLDVGDVLEISKAGELVRDDVRKETIQLPDERVGLLMVFRTFDKMSLGLILKTKKALSVGDKVANP